MRRRELLVVGVLALGAVAFWALVPTYPNYDAYYHLVWGREIVDGHLPTFEAYQAPTQHPLYLVICAVLGLFGEHADRLLVLFTCLCHVAFTYAVYRLGTAMWDRKAGVMAALLAGSSFALLLYAARAYVDEPFLALVLWAGALEAERSARSVRVVSPPHIEGQTTRISAVGGKPAALAGGTDASPSSATRPDLGGRAVWMLLVLAGLLRPEAWVLGGAYWLWLSWRARRPLWRIVALPLIAPIIWCAVDAIVTGDPLFSLHSTSDLADELNRTRSFSEVPGDFVSFLVDTARLPVALAAVAGIVWSWRRRDARAVHVALALFLAGSFTFFATSVAGLSVLPRYLTVPAVALCLPAGYLVTRSRALLAVAVVAGLAFVVIRADAFDRLATELRFIRSTHDDLTTVLHTPAVATGRRCGAITLPNYRLVPDTRWILDASQKQVGSRSAVNREHGVALLLVGEKLLRRYGFADGASPKTNAPPDGFLRGPIRGGFTAYVSCPEGG